LILIGDLASAIPLQLIGDMLGIPELEREPLRDWSLSILGALEPVLTQQQLQCGTMAVDDFKIYLRALIKWRSREQKLDEGEILSKLIAASELAPSGGSGEQLSDLELLHNCIFLLNAGHETTTNLIGNGIDLLIRNPDALQELRHHPELRVSAHGKLKSAWQPPGSQGYVHWGCGDAGWHVCAYWYWRGQS
jgi:cytochrome P450